MSHVMAYHMTLLAIQTRPNYSWMFNVNCNILSSLRHASSKL